MTSRRQGTKLEWYAYRHINGTLHLKRYWGDYGDIRECSCSPFVRKVTGPFEAKNQDTATTIMEARLA